MEVEASRAVKSATASKNVVTWPDGLVEQASSFAPAADVADQLSGLIALTPESILLG